MISPRLLVVSPVLLFAKLCFADAVFHLWFDAPQVVVPGSTFTLTAWAEVTGSILAESDGGFNSFGLDVVGTNLPVTFSPAQMPYFAALNPGTPEPNALREVIGLNLPEVGPFYTTNPIILFTTEVALTSPSIGVLQLDPVQIAWGDFILAWWLNHDAGTYVTDTDPGSTRIVTPAVVRVIPAPAPLGALAIAGVLVCPRPRR